jgi:hypothetical protein
MTDLDMSVRSNLLYVTNTPPAGTTPVLCLCTLALRVAAPILIMMMGIFNQAQSHFRGRPRGSSESGETPPEDTEPDDTSILSVLSIQCFLPFIIQNPETRMKAL